MVGGQGLCSGVADHPLCHRRSHRFKHNRHLKMFKWLENLANIEWVEVAGVFKDGMSAWHTPQ